MASYYAYMASYYAYIASYYGYIALYYAYIASYYAYILSPFSYIGKHHQHIISKEHDFKTNNPFSKIQEKLLKNFALVGVIAPALRCATNISL
jgi:hypothetical protein